MAKVTIIIEDTKTPENPGFSIRYKKRQVAKCITPAEKIGDQLAKQFNNKKVLAILCKKAGVI
ncbi:MAG: hypothetical protein ABFD75_11295 [Smithella sp.]